MTSAAHQPGARPMLNKKVLLAGGALAAVGGVLGAVGTALIGAAAIAALRQWAQGTHELVARARAASNAATAAAGGVWRQPLAGEITLPDVGTVVVDTAAKRTAE